MHSAVLHAGPGRRASLPRHRHR